jgi:hypothetical protein
MADCERGLGRPERALALAAEDGARALPADLQVELAMVVSGARLDLGEPDAAVAVLSTPVVRSAQGEQRRRVAEALVEALRAAGRTAEAERLASTLPAPLDEEDDVLVYDLEELSDATGSPDAADPSDSEDGAGVATDKDAAGAGRAVAAAPSRATDATGDVAAPVPGTDPVGPEQEGAR